MASTEPCTSALRIRLSSLSSPSLAWPDIEASDTRREAICWASLVARASLARSPTTARAAFSSGYTSNSSPAVGTSLKPRASTA